MKKIILMRLAVWLLCIGGLYGIYFFTASVFGIMAVIFIVSLTLISWAAGFYTRKHVTLSLRMPVTAAKEKSSVVSVFLENDGILPVFTSFVNLHVKNTLTGEENETVLKLSASPKSMSSGEFEIASDKCGYINISSGKVYLCDIFGIFPVKADVYSEGKISVMPETFDMNVNLSVSYISKTDEDMYSPDKSGSDYSETFQIREYVPGDSIKAIHYKLSEKMDAVYVKEASLPITRSVLVFWDKNARKCTPEEMDAMAEVTTSLCQSLCDEGHLFSLGYTDGEEIIVDEITHTEELFKAVGVMLRSGCDPSLSGAEIYSQRYGKAEYGKIIYIAGEIPASFGNFAGEGAVGVICSDMRGGSDIPTVYFSSETYMEDTENPEL